MAASKCSQSKQAYNIATALITIPVNLIGMKLLTLQPIQTVYV